MYKIDYALKTVKGKRETNQDYCTGGEIQKGIYFFSVADGMGGTEGGQIASKLVLENAIKILHEEFQYEFEDKELKFILERIFLSSQEIISKKIKENPSLAGMGTTLTCLLIKDDKYVWGNIGDSRIYLLRNSNLNQITTDHTYIEEIKNGGISVSDDILKKYGNFLQKALDGGKDKADIFPLHSNYEKLNDGDIFLLCSDGLIVDKTKDVSNTLKEKILYSTNLNGACQKLIKHALEGGSQDNISVILVGVGNYEKVFNSRRNISSLLHRIFSINKKRKYDLSTFIGFLIIIVSIIIIFMLNQEKKTYSSKGPLTTSPHNKNLIVTKPNEKKDIKKNNLNSIQIFKNDIPSIEFKTAKPNKKEISIINNKRNFNTKIRKESKNISKEQKLADVKPKPPEKLIYANKPNINTNNFTTEKNIIQKENITSTTIDVYNDEEFKQIINKLNELISIGDRKEAEKFFQIAMKKYNDEYYHSDNKELIKTKIQILQKKAKEIRNMK